MTSAAAQRRWRAKLRSALVEQFGAYCGAGGGPGCGANGGTRLDFAHKVPKLRPNDGTGPGYRGEGIDARLREVRNDPFAFWLACRDCHHAYDGPVWGRRTNNGRFRSTHIVKVRRLPKLPHEIEAQYRKDMGWE